MKILGTEECRDGESKFSLFVVDDLNDQFSILVKNGFLRSFDNYNKSIFTNGVIQKTALRKGNKYYEVTFNVRDADWLVLVDAHDNILVYINELYCGPIKVKNKKLQEMLDESYNYCRERIDSRIDSKREFAKRMGVVSRRLNLPFHIVLAFKGNEELLTVMSDNINRAIECNWSENVRLMSFLKSDDFREREKAIQYFGIVKIPSYQIEKISSYLYDCLKARRLIRRND